MSSISAGTTSTTTLVHSGDTTGSLVFKTNDTGSGGTTAVTIDTSQNVGIGTTSPAYPLDVAGNLRSNSWIGRANGSAPSADCAIYRATDNTLGFSTASTERMRIDSSGNVLVGTTSNITGGKVNIAQGSSDGTMYQMMQLTAGSGTGGNEVGQIKRQTTASVANSATTILNSMTFGELITVAGTGSGAIFADLLMASYNTVAVISSNTQQGGPASRTYSVSSGALRLTMGSATAMAITVQSLISGARGA